MFQSTHPQGVRRLVVITTVKAAIVSIHAPAGGATQQTDSRSMVQHGFNPRTRRGCDLSKVTALSLSNGFNPRTRRGCDAGSPAIPINSITFQSTHPQGVRLESCAHHPVQYNVSIHAPAGGATDAPTRSTARASMFQSTHPQGVRPKVAPIVAARFLFQSTHPQGVRQ